jgi:hypothetical protein
MWPVLDLRGACMISARCTNKLDARTEHRKLVAAQLLPLLLNMLHACVPMLRIEGWLGAINRSSSGSTVRVSYLDTSAEIRPMPPGLQGGADVATTSQRGLGMLPYDATHAPHSCKAGGCWVCAE